MTFNSISILVFLSMVMMDITSLRSQSYANTPIPEVLQEWEEKHGLISNFDFSNLSNYNYTGRLLNLSPSQDLQAILKETPYDFVAGSKIFTLYLTEKKHYNLCGQIITINGEALPYADILSASQLTGTITDSLGRFELTVEGFKNDIIKISYLGYKSKEVHVTELNGDCPTVIMEVTDQMLLNNIVIRDYLYDGISLSGDQGAVIYNYDVLASNPSEFEHDVLTALQLLPGVSSADESATNLNIRGSTPDQNLVLWENSTLYDPGHLFGMISSINPYSIDEVKLYKGVYNPKYDNRIGGLIDISLPSEVKEKITGSIGTSMTEVHGNLALPIIPNKMGLYIGGRQNLSSVIKTPTLNSYVNRVFQNTKIESEKEDASEGIIDASDQLNYKDLNLKWIYKPNSRISLSVSTLATSNSFNYSSEFIEEGSKSTDILEYNTKAWAFQSHLKWTDRLRTSVFYNSSNYTNSYSSDDINSDDESLIFSSVQYNDISDHTLTIDNTFEFSKDLSFNFGVISDTKAVSFSLNEMSELEEDYIAIFDQKEIFIHLYNAWKISKGRHNIDLSVKASRATLESSNWIFSPRGSYRYVANTQFQFKASAGRVYQFISQARELGITDINGGTNFWILTEVNQDNLLYADKFSAGMVYANQGWLLDIAAYRNNTQNLRIANNNGLDLINIDNPIGLRSEGIEVLVKKQWGNYNLWTNYSISNNQYTGINFNQYTPAEMDQRHKLSIVGRIDLNNWNIGLTYQYKSGLPLTEPSEVVSLTGADTGSFDILYNDGINQSRLTDYSRWDMSFSYTKHIGPNRIQASLALINLFNRQHIAARSYLVDNDEDDFGNPFPVLFSLEKRLLGFTPRLMVRFSF